MLLRDYVFIVGIKVENVSRSGGCLRRHNVCVWCMGGGLSGEVTTGTRLRFGF